MVVVTNLSNKMLLSSCCIRYKELVFYLEACESGSMFEDFPTGMNMYITTAANGKESSWGTYCAPNDMVNGMCVLYVVVCPHACVVRVASGAVLRNSMFVMNQKCSRWAGLRLVSRLCCAIADCGVL